MPTDYQSALPMPPHASSPTFERTFPGTVNQVRKVRAATRNFLRDCPVTDDVVTLISELTANACEHSTSGLPGGRFTVTVHDFPGDYVYADVRDQGSDWDADLNKATEWPHGLYLMQQIATTHGAAGGKRAWRIWFTVSYPATVAP